MQNKSKLKPTNWGAVLAAILAILVLVSIFIVIRNFVDYETKIKIYAIVYIIFSLINLVVWLTKKSLVNLSLIFICLVMAVSYFIDYKGIYVFIPLIIFWSFYGYFVYLYVKFNSRYRKILELAAKPVNGTADGFSSRPFPAGKAKFTREDLNNFAIFLRKHFIALPYFEKSGVVLALTDQSRFRFGHLNDKKDSYVYFNFDETISVNIARKDYQKYNAEYTFDELCESMGNLFKLFLVHFQEKNIDKILQHFK